MDIFSLGCVFLDIQTVLSGRSLSDFHAFQESDDGFAFHSSLQKVWAWVDKISDDLGHTRHLLPLIRDMLRLDPNERPSAREVWATAAGNPSDPSRCCGNCCLPAPQANQEVSTPDAPPPLMPIDVNGDGGDIMELGNGGDLGHTDTAGKFFGLGEPIIPSVNTHYEACKS